MRKSSIAISYVTIGFLAFIMSFLFLGGHNKLSSLFSNQLLISELKPTPPPASQLPPKPYMGPMISIDFDDGWKSAYTVAMPILEKHGFRATNSLITDTIGTSEGNPYMEIPDVKQWLAKGHAIGSHSLDHSDLSLMTEESIIKQGKNSKAKLEQLFATKVDYLVYPYCASSPKSETLLQDLYQVQRVCGLTEPSTRQVVNPKSVDSKVIEKTTTIPEIKKWIAEAKENNSWLILVYHKLENNPTDYMTITPATFQAQMQLIADSKIKVLPTVEAYNVFIEGKTIEANELAIKAMEEKTKDQAIEDQESAPKEKKKFKKNY
jgi:peptidoglycan/xylan/chitin deacetylase (PgdA/CDA1 family)